MGRFDRGVHRQKICLGGDIVDYSDNIRNIFDIGRNILDLGIGSGHQFFPGINGLYQINRGCRFFGSYPGDTVHRDGHLFNRRGRPGYGSTLISSMRNKISDRSEYFRNGGGNFRNLTVQRIYLF